jgi:hypothetical protein
MATLREFGRRRSRPSGWLVVALSAALVAVAGCAPNGAKPGTAAPGGTTGAASELGTANKACSLLTDQEVTDAIGAHLPPEPDLLYGGCLWKTGVGSVEDISRIIVAVVPPGRFEPESGAEPVPDFAPGAMYAPMYGELSWPCGGQVCIVKAAIVGPGARHQEVARQVGNIVKTRV